MGFVYNEQADAGAPEREDELQGPETLGGHVEHLHLPVRTLRSTSQRSRARVPSGAWLRRDRALKQGVDLVLHQRDQGRDYHRQALLHQRGHLVTEALAAAGGHHGERVPAFQNGPYDSSWPGLNESKPKISFRTLRGTKVNIRPDLYFHKAGQSASPSSLVSMSAIVVR